jgi:hypothetical protein
MRREYPNLFRAVDRNLDDGQIRKAYIADLVSLRGEAPKDLEDSAGLLSDPRFIDLLSTALSNRGRKVLPEEWMLVKGWVRKGFYKLDSNVWEPS